MFTKSALHHRSRAGSWAGSGDEGAGETKALGAGLCLDLVSDTQRSSQEKGHPAPTPTPTTGSTNLGGEQGFGSVRLRGTHCRGMPSGYLQFLANAAQEVISKPEFLTRTADPDTATPVISPVISPRTQLSRGIN